MNAAVPLNSVSLRITWLEQQIEDLNRLIMQSYRVLQQMPTPDRGVLENILYWMSHKEDLEEDLKVDLGLILGEKSEQP